MKDHPDLQLIPNLSLLKEYADGYPEGIHVTPDVIGSIGDGTTEQFREHAKTYDERYFGLEEQNRRLLARCKEIFPSFELSSVETILDIGCGSGNATFAMLDVLTDASVYATDISPDMVAILAERAEQRNVSKNIVPFISNAEKVNLKPESFDLIFGSSMVHHLNEPDVFLDRILPSLKPGGLCLFTEPFKVGHLILRMFLDELSRGSHYSHGIPDDIQEFFRSYIFTIDAMTTLDRTELDYSKLDDKWMFSRNFFEETAKRNDVNYGFFCTDAIENRFVFNIERLVWLGLGQKWTMPEPARDFVARFDASLPLDVMDEIPSSGCIIFKKN
ncbi:class I SAM-dependent methyltransferase [Ruegeria sp. EL01]|jgi:ubiquinone/menaquinone biosynthesis C-methylase UbiE|uniref:class I SAM-dependent methyltransferase n=1 Tax=Ruegeria sp. EL01 TaxID=2107578 RepID=UPI000EA8122A|nr:class I SAM-dependent methyltransferase [Ruegeria sp. EL01]